MNVLLHLVGFGGTFIVASICLENLAQNVTYKGNASQSSVHYGGVWPADKAVDGQLQGKDSRDTCSFTGAIYYKTAWWKFTLLQLSNVAYLLLFFRKATVNRHTGFSVFVFNESSYIPPSTNGRKVFTQDPSQCPKQMMNVTINKVTKGIALFNSKIHPLNTSCTGYEPSFATIEICELMVMGCHFQHYGESCISCSLKCLNQECDAFNGSCIYGCSNSFMVPPDCTICKRGYYGHNCERPCGKYKTGTTCNNITGICPDGCQGNWNGSNCDVCQNGFYDENCMQTCGNCKSGNYCHKVTGICQKGCDDHWDGSKCSVCRNGFYGTSCENTCGRCAAGMFCDNFTGICPDGCQDHWNGIKCDVCKSGYYGHNCERRCGKCKTDTVCNNITGICPGGCQGHWIGLNCDVCKKGFYGDNCTQSCGHCKPGTYCDNITGLCQEGCDDNWYGSQCKVCCDGYYGLNCESNCGQCLTGSTCNKSTGICHRGCKENWTGPKCDECKNYKYGPNCVFDCGHCKNRKPCSIMNGTCGEGCEPGWSGLFCLKVFSSNGDLQDEGIFKTSSIILCLVSTLFAVTLICVRIRVVYNKRKLRNTQGGKDQTDSIQAKSVPNPPFYDQMTDLNDHQTYQEITSSSKHSINEGRHVYDNTEFTVSK